MGSEAGEFGSVSRPPQAGVLGQFRPWMLLRQSELLVRAASCFKRLCKASRQNRTIKQTSFKHPRACRRLHVASIHSVILSAA